MASRLTKKQQTELTEKLTGIIQKNNALQLRLSADRTVNEMNVNQISGELNRIHGQAIGKELPTEINIPVKQLGSGDPSPDNIRPIVGYEIDGIGTVYGGDLNIETGQLTVTMGGDLLSTRSWSYLAQSMTFLTGTFTPMRPGVNAVCPIYRVTDSWVTAPTWINGDYLLNAAVEDRRIRIKDTRYTSAAEFTSNLGDTIFVYELETPETYALTPQQMLQLLDQL